MEFNSVAFQVDLVLRTIMRGSLVWVRNDDRVVILLTYEFDWHELERPF